MKKFLFTLAALLMAGTAVATEYWYVEDFEVSKDLLAQTAAKNRRMTVPVKAHFDAYVNSWQVDFGSVDGTNMDPKPVDNTLPAGVSIYTGKAGAPMTIAYMDDLGEDVTQQIGLGMSQNNTRFIGTVGVVGGFWYAPGMDPDNDDPVTYGSIKWNPGDYDAFFTVTFQFDQDFKGGDIWIRSAPASGTDARGPVTDQVVTYHKLTISVEQDAEQATEPTIDITGDYAKTITITGEEGATLYYSFDNENWTLYEGPVTVSEAGDYTVYAYAVGPDNKTQSTTAEKPFTVTVYVPEQAQTPNIDITGEYAKTITITGETGATLYYSLDNENWYAYTAPIVVTEAGDYTVYAYAVGPQDKTKSVVAEKSFTVTVYVPGQAEKPVITVANNNTTEVTVTITGEAGAKLYYEVTPANRAYAEYTEALVYNTPGTYKITAYAVGPDDKTQSELAEETFTVKAPDQPTPAGSFSYESDWQNYYFTVTGDNPQLIIDGEVATTNTIERPAYGQDPIVVSVQVTTNKGEGYTPTTTDPVEVTIMPQLPEVSISAVPGQGHIDWIPGVGYDYENAVDGHYVDVSFATEPGYEIHYVITGPNGAKWEGTYDGEPIHLDKNGTYNVEAWVVSGEDAGKVATDSFKIDNNTGVNELVNGKTVAGVRYFNMAGQEMQEANGMTIVVTTYTDGTTSAVKVMK